jgi:hypothetical protein
VPWPQLVRLRTLDRLLHSRLVSEGEARIKGFEAAVVLEKAKALLEAKAA